MNAELTSNPVVGSIALFGGWRRLSEPPGENGCFFWFRSCPGWDAVVVRIYREHRRWMLNNPFAHGGPEYLEAFMQDDLCRFCGPIPEPPNDELTHRR